ncbi:MAG: hypothetical protein FWF56_06875 [Firmicutes bacterium]|nr:hypothetical protein [Bacillota bacterium]
MNEKQRSNSLAKAGMIVGIIAICTCGGFFITNAITITIVSIISISGIVISYLGLMQSKQTGIGLTQAKTGLILSIIATALALLTIILFATGNIHVVQWE